MACFKPGSLGNTMTFWMSTETTISLLGTTLTFLFWYNDRASVAVSICFRKVSHSVKFGKTFLFFLLSVDCVIVCVLFLTQHMLLFQIGAICKPRTIPLPISQSKCQDFWPYFDTDTMLGWNIHPVWYMSSSVMADRRVMFLNMTY